MENFKQKRTKEDCLEKRSLDLKTRILRKNKKWWTEVLIEWQNHYT